MTQHVTKLPFTRPAFQRELRASGGRSLPIPKQGQRWPRRGYKIRWEPPGYDPERARLVGLTQIRGGRLLGVVRLESGAVCDDVPLTQIRRHRWWSR